MRLEPVRMKKNDSVNGYLEFYMGKNTPDRQDFIIENLRIEEDIVERKRKIELNELLMEEELDINQEGKAGEFRQGLLHFIR